jgi:hypothetical protein
MGPLFFASLQCDRFCISIVCANFVPVKRAASAVPIGSPHRALFITAGPAVSIGLPYPVDLGIGPSWIGCVEAGSLPFPELTAIRRSGTGSQWTSRVVTTGPVRLQPSSPMTTVRCPVVPGRSLRAKRLPNLKSCVETKSCHWSLVLRSRSISPSRLMSSKL